ncbi:DTW domain-containing protein, partial [Pseudomonas sp. KHB2.9]
SEVLDAYLDVFSTHYLAAKFQLPLDSTDIVHTRLAPYIPAV